jgi:hypothetical protein
VKKFQRIIELPAVNCGLSVWVEQEGTKVMDTVIKEVNKKSGAELLRYEEGPSLQLGSP